jgi:4-hydroxy-tetrahydrodipicolinate reductase
MIQSQAGYKPSMEETHHVHKLDEPSGTAITLAEGILENSRVHPMVSARRMVKMNVDPLNQLEKVKYLEFTAIQYKSDIDAITIEARGI